MLKFRPLSRLQAFTICWPSAPGEWQGKYFGGGGRDLQGPWYQVWYYTQQPQGCTSGQVCGRGAIHVCPQGAIHVCHS